MNFDFSQEQQQLRGTVRRFLADHCTSKDVRAALEGKVKYDAALWKGLAELGLIGVAIPAEYGGTDAGALELCVIAEELGRALAPIPFASTVYFCAEAHSRRLRGAEAGWLPKIAAGEVIGCFATVERPGVLHRGAGQARVEGGKLTGTKLPVTDGDIADVAVVLARARTATRPLPGRV